MTDQEPQAPTADFDKVSEALALRDTATPAGLAPAMASIGLPSPAEWAALTGMAEQLAQSDLVPKSLQGKPANVMLVMLKGRDLGISPTTALSLLHVVDGKVGQAAELMGALVRRAGFMLWPDPANNAQQATAHATRDGEHHQFTFTLEDAVRAGLCTIREGKPYARSSYGKVLPWESYPQFLLWARAVSGLCRMVFQDVLVGVSYTPEELGAHVNEQGEPIDLDPGAYRAAGEPDPAELARREAERVAAERANADQAAKADGWEGIDESDVCWAWLLGEVGRMPSEVAVALRIWKQDHPGRSRTVWAAAAAAAFELNESALVWEDDPFDSPAGSEEAAGAALFARVFVMLTDAGETPSAATLASEVAHEAATVPIPPCEADAADGAEKAPDGHTGADPGPFTLMRSEPADSESWRHWVATVDKGSAVTWLVARKLPTNGPLSVLRQRMIEHANLRGQAETVVAV